MFILEFFRRHLFGLTIIILIILYIFLPTKPQPIMPRQPVRPRPYLLLNF